MKSDAIIFTQPNVVTIGEIHLPDPSPGQIITQTHLSGVSTGTETRVLLGQQPDTHFSLIPGYENIGSVIKVGKNVKGLKPGNRVFHAGSAFTGPYCRAWGAQVAYALTRAEDAVMIPQSMSDTKAIYTKHLQLPITV
jgi:bacteriochlorophyllide a dehydrogenase